MKKRVFVYQLAWIVSPGFVSILLPNNEITESHDNVPPLFSPSTRMAFFITRESFFSLSPFLERRGQSWAASPCWKYICCYTSSVCPMNGAVVWRNSVKRRCGSGHMCATHFRCVLISQIPLFCLLNSSFQLNFLLSYFLRIRVCLKMTMTVMTMYYVKSVGTLGRY